MLFGNYRFFTEPNSSKINPGFKTIKEKTCQFIVVNYVFKIVFVLEVKEFFIWQCFAF